MSHANKKPDKVLRAVMPVIPAKAGIQQVASRALREISSSSIRQAKPALIRGTEGVSLTIRNSKNEQTNPFGCAAQPNIKQAVPVFVDLNQNFRIKYTMARIQKPPPGRLVVSIIYSSMDALADAVSALEKKFGRVQFETLEIPCHQPEEYFEEMGDSLLRRFYSFDKQVPRDTLPALKASCYKLEPRFSDTVDGYHFRTVNIDPGILTPSALVMASHKEYNHRVYLRDGVWAEMSLIYAHDKFCRLPWTNPDFCNDEAVDFFERVRETFEIIEPAREAINS